MSKQDNLAALARRVADAYLLERETAVASMDASTAHREATLAFETAQHMLSDAGGYKPFIVHTAVGPLVLTPDDDDDTFAVAVPQVVPATPKPDAAETYAAKLAALPGPGFEVGNKGDTERTT